MRERRAVSSFFFERLTLMRRLPPLGWVGEDPVFTRVSFSREDYSLVFFLCDEEPLGTELNILLSALTAALVC